MRGFSPFVPRFLHVLFGQRGGLREIDDALRAGLNRNASFHRDGPFGVLPGNFQMEVVGRSEGHGRRSAESRRAGARRAIVVPPDRGIGVRQNDMNSRREFTSRLLNVWTKEPLIRIDLPAPIVISGSEKIAEGWEKDKAAPGAKVAKVTVAPGMIDVVLPGIHGVSMAGAMGTATFLAIGKPRPAWVGFSPGSKIRSRHRLASGRRETASGKS